MESSPLSKASPEITEKYKNILTANGISDEVSEVLLEINPKSIEGAGMGSQPSYVTIRFTDPKVKPLNLFVKENRTSDSEFHDAMKIFEKESRFFTEYVPAIKEFCKANGQEKLVDFYPKCYYGDKKMIVFENLVVNKGYILLSKMERQGLESAKLAMITLGKHHAISHAFIKKQFGGPEAFFKRFPNLDYEAYGHQMAVSILSTYVENGIAAFIKILEKTDVSGKEEALSILQTQVGKGFQTCLETLEYRPEEEKILTLNHGDYWNNNMMFLRDENNKLHSHVTYDFQVTRYNSPAVDVGNFMYTSMKAEVRRAHLKELVQLYFDVLLETSSKLGSPLQLTFDEFFELLRKKVVYGFWFGMVWLAADVTVPEILVADPSDGEGKTTKDSPVKLDKLIQQWIDENPQKSEEEARNIVELMKEYSNLVLKN